MSRPRPLHIVHVSQPTRWGVAVCAHALAAHQQAVGHRVTVLSPVDGDLATWCRRDGITHRRWDADRSPVPVTEAHRLGRLIDELRPDVVHLHSSKAGLAGRLAVRGRRTTIFHPNAWSFFAPSRHQAVARGWERFAARWTDLFIMASDDELAQARRAGIRGRFVTIPNGVDTQHFAVASQEAQRHAREQLGLDDRPTAVCVGRLCEQKGQDLLLEAWPEVVGRVPTAQVVLVGGGAWENGVDHTGWEERLRAAAPSSVIFAGHQDDVLPWYRAADVAVQPSRWEGFSFATLEALAVGRPVVAFDAPGMRQAIDGAGAVVPIGAVDLLADALAMRLADLPATASEGTRGATAVRARYSVEAFCDAVTAATEALVAGAPVALERP